MTIFKHSFPVLLLLVLSFYTYHSYDQFPEVIVTAVIFLPVVMFLLTLGLSVHFNRSTVFFYVILIAATNMALGMGLISTYLGYALFSIAIPALFLVYTLLPERGVFSANAAPAYGILFTTLFITFVLALMSPEWLRYLLLIDWLPARYFDWTPLPQSILLLFVLLFITMLVLSFVRPSPHMFAATGMLILLMVQLHAGATSRSLNIFTSAAFLLCLYAILQESWRMAYLDELTELPARRALREKFQQVSGVYTVAMIDVDHFKKFNDTYGHDTGDAVLRMIAGKLSKVTGGGVSYRYGGEEFSVIFNGRDVRDAHTHLEKLREAIASSLFVVNRKSRRKNDNSRPNKNNKTVTITVSIGVADSTASVNSPWDVLKLADKALYRAKNKGRNCICT
ncbi:MAG: GGDEF domain-containing protein [Gammaproteobacteria bacterium]|nr:GGDEF domain-containing protein [Gammaproteobacteria bacterium]